MGLQQKLQDAGRGIEGPDVAVDLEAPPAVQRLQARAVRLIEKLRDILHEVAELGVEVKAADGLVDFRSKLHGRTVYLCWKYGEEGVGYFQELDAGFGGGRPASAAGLRRSRCASASVTDTNRNTTITSVAARS